MSDTERVRIHCAEYNQKQTASERAKARIMVSVIARSVSESVSHGESKHKQAEWETEVEHNSECKYK